MFGHGVFPCELDPGVGVECEGVVVVGVLVVPDGAAEATAMPANAPPTASVPTTIVALIIGDTCIRCPSLVLGVGLTG